MLVIADDLIFILTNVFSIIHLFNWSALIDEDKDLGQVLSLSLMRPSTAKQMWFSHIMASLSN